MRMNYKSYPTDYVQELNAKGLNGRRKAMAFMSYWNDMEHQETNAISFYQASWRVSRGTAWNWVQEFNKEIDLFLAHWSLRNRGHYSNVKNQVERELNNEMNDKDSYKKSSIPKQDSVCEDSHNIQNERIDERQLKQALNINDDDGAGLKREFDNLFFIYGQNGGFTGNKEKAFDFYIQMRDKVELKDLVKSISLYLRDDSVMKKWNIENFLRNEIYLTYIDIKIKMFSNDEWLYGRYDKEKEIFYNETIKGVLKMDVFNRKILENEIIIVGREIV